MKKYNPVKIIDPSSNAHSVRLHPTQNLHVIISKETKDNDTGNIQIISDYLVQEDVIVTDESITFVIGQKYDLSDWSPISTVFLGNIRVSYVVNRQLEDGSILSEDYVVVLCAYLNCSNKKKAQVLTVINPTDQQVIKFQPDQVLHFVVFDECYKMWQVSVDNLQCLRSETVHNDFFGRYNQDDYFCSEPRSLNMPFNPHLKESVRKQISYEEYVERITEHHFWFYLKPDMISEVSEFKNGIYEMEPILFEGSGTNRLDTIHKRANICLSIRGSRKPASLERYRQISFFSKNWHIRYVSDDRTSVINPSLSDSLDLKTNTDWIYLEIPEPAHYLGSEFRSKYWQRRHTTPDGRIDIKEMSLRYVNGVGVQRFYVSDIIKHHPTGNTKFIGALNFAIEVPGETIPSKRLNITLWKDQKVNTNFKPSYTYTPPSKPVNNYEMSSVCEIELEQIEIVTLASGVQVSRLSAIKPDVKKSTYECEVYDYSYLQNDLKKKEVQAHVVPNSHTVPNSRTCREDDDGGAVFSESYDMGDWEMMMQA